MPEQPLAYLISILLSGPVITDNTKINCSDGFQDICIFLTLKLTLLKIVSIICSFNLMETEKMRKNW